MKSKKLIIESKGGGGGGGFELHEHPFLICNAYLYIFLTYAKS